ncbi:unnamed protein product [Sphenostylis stenocarpa]|uniref:Uncharacterized protein n=1 Tax=Sphenostylis stenocarpa TaxID=92480 RepID=A0AA86T0A6_9FABA|nr:unnamed protein product [Sphenostylis stenocarpa]
MKKERNKRFTERRIRRFDPEAGDLLTQVNSFEIRHGSINGGDLYTYINFIGHGSAVGQILCVCSSLGLVKSRVQLGYIRWISFEQMHACRVYDGQPAMAKIRSFVSPIPKWPVLPLYND